jgi:hypothetical protein
MRLNEQALNACRIVIMFTCVIISVVFVHAAGRVPENFVLGIETRIH